MTASLAAIVSQARYKPGWLFWLHYGGITVIGATRRPGTAGPIRGRLAIRWGMPKTVITA